ncbi:MAG: phage terminase large subunit [Caldisericia bacterium]|nr:phage terminase large subunit [Caldisericia bacterium]
MNDEFQNFPDKIDPELLKNILQDRKALIAVTKRSFFWFFYIYFGRYLKYPIAPFHLEMIKIAQDESIKRAGVMSFRDSAKSTILNTAFALWAIMGIHQKKHVVIASQSQQRAKDHLMNIRKETENNKLLGENLGPFREIEDRWQTSILIITNYGARISAISKEEGIRGLREGPYRPDLIIADDIEDSNSVKTRENRDKTFNWFTGELLPLGEINTKVIVLGNFLHEDSVLSRLGEMIKAGKMKGTFLRIPLVDEKDRISWPGKFTSPKMIEDLKQSIGNEITWQRDFLLRSVPDDYQIIYSEWIKYYDSIPNKEDEKNKYCYTATAVDLAISEKETAHFTAMVSAMVFGYGENIKIHILPNPVNERLNFPETVKKAKEISMALGSGIPTAIYIEEVGYQKSLIQELQKEGFPAEGVPVGGQDKTARLHIVAPFVQTGRVLFPKKGCEVLIRQLTGFGIEKYDDLADAFAMLIGKVMEKNKPAPTPFPIQDANPDPKYKPFSADLWDKEF